MTIAFTTAKRFAIVSPSTDQIVEAETGEIHDRQRAGPMTTAPKGRDHRRRALPQKQEKNDQHDEHDGVAQLEFEIPPQATEARIVLVRRVSTSTSTVAEQAARNCAQWPGCGRTTAITVAARAPAGRS